MPRVLPTPTIGTKGGVIGHPRKKPPADAAERIRAHAANGCSKVAIASDLGCGREVFARWLKDYPDLQMAFDLGREKERQVLHGRLFQEAMAGEGKTAIISAMFLLKTRHGYREGAPAEGGSHSTVTINMPGAMSLDDFRRGAISIAPSGEVEEDGGQD
jgi:hypothetical protein